MASVTRRPPAEDYSGRTKYDEHLAHRYRTRSERRRKRENAALVEILTTFGVRGRLLDVPCGAGRVASLVPEPSGGAVAGDISIDMLGQARERFGPSWAPARLDVEALALADRAFDVTLCLRLLHHLPPPVRPRVLAELARVTDRLLVVTFFHPFAAHAASRKVRQVFRRHTRRFSCLTGTLARELRPHGFSLRATRRTGFLRETWYAVFVRDEAMHR